MAVGRTARRAPGFVLLALVGAAAWWLTHPYAVPAQTFSATLSLAEYEAVKRAIVASFAQDASRGVQLRGDPAGGSPLVAACGWPPLVLVTFREDRSTLSVHDGAEERASASRELLAELAESFPELASIEHRRLSPSRLDVFVAAHRDGHDLLASCVE